MLAFVWNNQDSFSCSNKNYTFSNFLLFFVLMHISLYYNILKYLAIYNKLKVKCNMFPSKKKKKTKKTKNQDVEFFTYIIYIIYSNVITLFWDGFKTITCQIFHLKKKKKIMSNFFAHWAGLRLVMLILGLLASFFPVSSLLFHC